MNSLLLSIAVLCGLTACVGDQGEDQDLRQWAEAKRKIIQPRVKPLEVPVMFTPQPYVNERLLDPFSKRNLTLFFSREATAQNAASLQLLQAEQSRQKEELEHFPLSTMSMVGSLQKQGQVTALLKVNQQIYPVQVGSYLGQNYGRVVQIEEHSIKLREVVQDGLGGWAEKMTTLNLQERDN